MYLSSGKPKKKLEDYLTKVEEYYNEKGFKLTVNCILRSQYLERQYLFEDYPRLKELTLVRADGNTMSHRCFQPLIQMKKLF